MIKDLARRFHQQANTHQVIELINSISEKSIDYQLKAITKSINKSEKGSHKRRLLTHHFQ